MNYKVMITSLYRGDSNDGITYYYAKQGERRMYCDAMMSAEASCKYMLSNYDIDEIVTFGTKSTYDEGDELIPIVLKEGKSFYASDTGKLSTYSLLRYRLAEFIDEVDIEKQDLRDLISEDEQNRLEDLLKRFFRETVNTGGDCKFSRFFDMLANESGLRSELIDYISKELDENTDFQKYQRWISNYLYDEMKDSSKFEVLDSNNDVKIRFIPLNKGKSIMLDNLIKCLQSIAEEEEGRELEIYMCVQSDDATDSFILVNLMDALKTFPNTNMELKKIATTTKQQDELANKISDGTETFGISELLAGTRAFLKYGKTDILLDYWNRMGVHNEFIERMLYAMRNIDTGISLCDISDIERGIVSLKKLLVDANDSISGATFTEYFFLLIANAIIQDYGKLLESNEIEFIDLVKWAYRKEFWQQTLTIIESRAPGDFVRKGIFYYCSNEEEKERAIKEFGKLYFDLKPYEKYKLEDIPHYFVKFYGRMKMAPNRNKKAAQSEYARFRVREIDTNDEDMLKAYTLCSDKDVLKELLFAYYYLGDVRNATNHATDDHGGFASIMKDSDVGERMGIIRQSVELFIQNYEKACEVLNKEEGASNSIIEIEQGDVAAYAGILRAQARERKYKNGYGNKNNNDKNKENNQ